MLANTLIPLNTCESSFTVVKYVLEPIQFIGYYILNVVFNFFYTFRADT